MGWGMQFKRSKDGGKSWFGMSYNSLLKDMSGSILRCEIRHVNFSLKSILWTMWDRAPNSPMHQLWLTIANLFPGLRVNLFFISQCIGHFTFTFYMHRLCYIFYYAQFVIHTMDQHITFSSQWNDLKQDSFYPSMVV